MNSPRFSICTTNYNCAHALKQHLDSIYSQLDEKEFEYIVVDSKSTDSSMDVLNKYASSHENMTVLQKKCVRGIGRQMALKRSTGKYILQVDCDTVYFPIWRTFIYKCLELYPDLAVQAIFSGVYPRKIMDEVGGWRNFQWGDDLDLWMRVWKTGKMRWYPVAVGENVKEEGAESYMDALSKRYSGKMEKSFRMLRTEIDRWKLRKEREMDLPKIFKENSVDFDLGEEQVWVHKSPKENILIWVRGVLRKERMILQK
ncbi:MAG: glycosyltransferase family 2 protein [Methanomassiliicoccales archaeon]|nr:MAG: glycosyltransferase family 2 protein [Methanomassiliicoccales archaeon]